MHRTRIDLPEAARSKLIQLLNDHLADAIDLKLQAKQAHWNVKGPNFIALHELFDETATELEEFTDLIAERVTTLGGTAEGTVQAAGKKTRLPEYPINITNGRDHVDALAGRVAALGKSVRKAIDLATELRDADTTDLFTEVSRGLDKRLWFLEAHLQAEK